MSLKLIEKHRSFGGEQYKYRHYSQSLKCDMTFSIYLPANKEEKKNPPNLVAIWLNLYR
ncbi:S-formylglutathione hydrolase FrmB [Lysinibacillus sphaericus]